MNEEFVGTMPVQERHRFDAEHLERYLRQHVTGFSGNLEVEQFKGGQSESHFQTDGRRQAVRIAPQATGQAAAICACSGPRVPRFHRAARQWCAVAKPTACAKTTP